MSEPLQKSPTAHLSHSVTLEKASNTFCNFMQYSEIQTCFTSAVAHPCEGRKSKQGVNFSLCLPYVFVTQLFLTNGYQHDTITIETEGGCCYPHINAFTL